MDLYMTYTRQGISVVRSCASTGHSNLFRGSLLHVHVRPVHNCPPGKFATTGRDCKRSSACSSLWKVHDQPQNYSLSQQPCTATEEKLVALAKLGLKLPWLSLSFLKLTQTILLMWKIREPPKLSAWAQWSIQKEPQFPIQTTFFRLRFTWSHTAW